MRRRLTELTFATIAADDGCQASPVPVMLELFDRLAGLQLDPPVCRALRSGRVVLGQLSLQTQGASHIHQAGSLTATTTCAGAAPYHFDQHLRLSAGSLFDGVTALFGPDGSRGEFYTGTPSSTETSV